MIDAALETGLALVDQYGLVVLLVAFALEGALVGKLVPTRALLVGVVVGLGTGAVSLVSVFAVAVVGATLGQCLLFASIRWRGPDPEHLPVATERVERGIDRLDRFGLPAVAFSNVVPGVRGTLTIPVALSRAPARRFGLWSLVGTAVYVGVLVAIAVGIDAGVDALAH